MILTRFCSLEEYNKFIDGEVLVNETDHYRNGMGGSLSVGFCFIEDEPTTAWRYLKGIVSPDVCMVLDIDEALLTKSMGKYVDYGQPDDGYKAQACLKREYYLTRYSNKTARLVRTLTPLEFSTLEELRVLELIKPILKLGRFKT